MPLKKNIGVMNRVKKLVNALIEGTNEVARMAMDPNINPIRIAEGITNKA